MNATTTPVSTLNSMLPGTPRGAYAAWREAMESLDIERVLALYETDEGVLWGTLANELKQGRKEIRTYFDSFLDRCSLKIDPLSEDFRQAGPGLVIANGLYRFHLGGHSWTEPKQTVLARFSFVFRSQSTGNGWLILDHHSSLLPESASSAQAA